MKAIIKIDGVEFEAVLIPRFNEDGDYEIESLRLISDIKKDKTEN
ncbi:hypothetical protein [Priestia koreensis]|nr:hypothetical protein [Priestia koreensis]